MWSFFQRTNGIGAKVDMILYRLEEQKTLLAAHDLAEVARDAVRDLRVVALELRSAEQKGALGVVAIVAAVVGSVVGAVAATALEHFLFGGR
jgi:hypothetical protein